MMTNAANLDSMLPKEYKNEMRKTKSTLTRNTTNQVSYTEIAAIKYPVNVNGVNLM